ncbi:Ig-like domain-containing protein [Galbibacter sp.]|uniref:Ig-like domain-containing protein n=1 Tax=Galbibacter sp. TaxID=2918471 RepID=UPI003A8D4E93
MKQKLPTSCRIPHSLDLHDSVTIQLNRIEAKSSTINYSGQTQKTTLLILLACILSLALGHNSLQAQISNAPPNEISPWVTGTYSDLQASLVDDVPSLVPVCLGAAIDEGNLIDNDLDNSGTISFLLGLGVGGGCNATFGVSDPNNTYPAGTWAGFRIGTSGLLTAMVDLQITISTYNNGVPTADVLELTPGLISANLLFGDSSNVGLVTTEPFDEIRITYETLVGLLYTAQVYHASIVAFQEGPILACNTTTPMMRPVYPMSISEDNTNLGSIIQLNASSDLGNVIDSDPDNYATLDFTLGSGSLSVKDELSSYTAGTFAGFDMESTSLLSIGLLDGITISTYLDGVFQEDATGTSDGILALNTSILGSGNERGQIGFITTLPFDEVQITGTSLLGSMNVYGLALKAFCVTASDALACNTPVMATEPDFPLVINGVNTGVSGVGLGAVTNTNAIIDADPANFATIDMTLGALGSASLSVLNPIESYPENTYVGFDLETGGLLNLDLLNGVTLTTYLDGAVQQTVDGNSEALLAVNSGLLFGNAGRYQLGFVATTDFDEVQISVDESLVSVDLGVTNIYGFILERLCEAPITCEVTPLSNPGQPVIINSEGTGVNGVLSVGSTLEDVQNVITEDATDFATLTLAVGALETMSLSVLNPLGQYASGSQAGFMVRKVDGLLELGLLDQITVSTYLDGTEVDSETSTGLLLLDALDLISIDLSGGANPEGVQFIGVTTTGAYDEVRIEIGALADVINQFEVYGAYVNPLTIDGLDNNPTVQITSIGEDNVINLEESTSTTVPVVGTAGGDAVEGDNVAVTVNGVSYAATVLADNTFTVDVPGAGLIADPTLTVTALLSHVGTSVPCTTTAEASLVYTIDTTPPTVPTVDTQVTNDQTPVITGTADSVDDLTVTVNGVTYTEGDGSLVDNGDGTWTLTVPAGNEIPDGIYDVVATATDAAGNPSIDDTDSELTIDTVAPTLPTVDVLVTNDQTPSITGTVDSVDDITVTVNGVTYTEGDGNLVDNGDGTWVLEIPTGNEIPEGVYDVVATAEDTAGNTSSDDTLGELTIDLTDPIVPTVNEQTTSNHTPTLTGTADSADMLTVTVNSVTYTEGDGDLVDNGDDTWTLQIPTGNEIPDGTYDVVATATDLAGNSSVDATVDELIIDPNALTTPTVDLLNTNDTTPMITGTADSSDDLTVTVNGITYTEGDGDLVDNGDDTWTLQIPDGNPIPDGVYDVEATVTDSTASTSTDVTDGELTIDTVAPVAPTVNPVVTNDPTPIITGTADSGDTLTVTVNGVTYTEGDGNLVDHGDGTWTLQIPDGNEISDGVYDVVATATDLAGNTSSDGTVDELTIDLTAPTVPTVVPQVTNDQTPTITGTVDSVDDITITVNGVTYTEGDGNLVDNGDGTWTLQIPLGNEIPEGIYDVVATATDAVGNTSTDSTQGELTIDLTPPTVPIVNAQTTSDSTPMLTGTADSVDDLTVTVDNITYTEGDGNLIDNGDDTWTLQIPDGNEIPDGTYDVVATVTDTVGNTISDGTVDELTIDPNAISTPTVNKLYTNDPTPIITGTADSADDLTVEVDGVVYTEADGNLVDNGNNTWTLQIPDGNTLLDGDYDVVATATDTTTGGTSVDTTTNELTIDRQAPTVPTVHPLVTNSPTPEITGTADSADVLTVEVNGVTYTEGDGNLVDHGDGTWTLQIPVGNEIPDGVYDVVATATDLAGNTSIDGSIDELTIDTIVPIVPTVNPLVTNSTTPEITGTADSADVLTVEVNGVTYTEGDGNLVDHGDGTWTLQVPVGNEIPDGVYDVVATATDLAGNTSIDGSVDELTINSTTPMIPTVNPLVTNSSTPKITGTADSTEELTVGVNGVVYTEGNGDLVDNGDNTWTLQIPAGNEIPDGIYDVSATTMDAVGNISADITVDELTINSSLPTTPTVDPIATPDSTPLITGTADSEDDLTVEVNGVVYTEGDGNLVDNGDGTWTLQIPDGNEIPVGTYDVVVTVTDGNGNIATDTTTDELTIDADAPTTPTVDPIATPDSTPLITGTADSEDDLTVEVDGVVYTEGDGNLVDNGDGTWTLQVPDGNEIPVGTYDVVVTVTDDKGNTATDTTTDELTIDVLPVSDISITKVADQLNPLVGDLINFTVTINNNGATEFSELVIDEVITSGFTYNRHTASIGNYNSTTGQWKLENLGANQTATLEVSVQVNPTGNHTNIASIRSSIPEDDNANNTAEVTIELNCLQVFNEFTPNFDGYNDYFRIECIEQYPNSVLKIFNRYGNKVYEAVGYQNDWTGIANVNGAVRRGKELPAGVYYYSLVVREIGVDKSGWLYIAK